MNLILHQFKTDARHFRWRLLLLWLAFAASPVMNLFHNLPGIGMGVAVLLISIWETFFALVIVLAVVQADPLTGDSAAWLCRPLRRRHLFWAKSAFIILCLFLPWLAAQSLGWAMRGYSWQLGWNAAEESLLFGLTIILVVAVLAALTPGNSRFFLAVGIIVAGMFAWVMTVDMLTHMGVLRDVHTDFRHEAERSASAATVAWLVLAVGTFAAWLWQARGGHRRAAFCCLALGLLSFPLITTIWRHNFLAAKLMPSAPVTLSLPDSGHPAPGPQGQWIAAEMLVSNVPAHQVAVIEELSAWAIFSGEKKSRLVPAAPHNFYQQHRLLPMESSAQDDYLRVVRDGFPGDTVWFYDDYYGGIGSAFDRDFLKNNYFHGPLPPANLDGQVTVDLYGVQKIADLPLEHASIVARPGVRVTIQKIVLADGIITVSLDESHAELMFNRDVNTLGNGNDNIPLCLYVLYHPGSGEAYVVSQRNAMNFMPSLLSGESHLGLSLQFAYPALRERLAGISAADWLREARLCVFAPVYSGTSQLAFHQDDFHWSNNYVEPIRQQKEAVLDAQAIQKAILPADYTDAQLDAYLDQVLLNVPEYFDKAQRQNFRKKLSAIGTRGVPALLDRLPLAPYVENSLIFPVVTNLITRDQLPELRAALQRDDRVVNVFIGKHWEADARDILVARLADHHQPMTAAALRVAAEAKDPSTYADLRWQLVHLESGQDQVVDTLKQCPGFDVAGAIRAAWQNARLGVTGTDNLAMIAAGQNLPDALNQAVAQTAVASNARTQQRELAQLAALTGYHGPTNNMLPWLAANLTRFQYDEAQQHYILEPAP